MSNDLFDTIVTVPPRSALSPMSETRPLVRKVPAAVAAQFMEFRPTQYFDKEGVVTAELHSMMVDPRTGSVSIWYDFVVPGYYFTYYVTPCRIELYGTEWMATIMPGISLKSEEMDARRENGKRSLREALR